MISHLVNRQDPGADHLCFGRNKRGHDQTGAVTEAQAWFHIQSLRGKDNANSHTLALQLMTGIHTESGRKSGPVPENALCVQEWLKQKPSCSLK